MESTLGYTAPDLIVKMTLYLAVIYTLFQPLELPYYTYIPLIFWGGFCLLFGKKGLVLLLVFLFYLVVSHYQYTSGSTLSLPFQPHRISRIQGRLNQEPSWDRRGNLRLSLSLVSVESREGQHGEASGTLSASLPAHQSFGSRRWLRGDQLSLQGLLLESGSSSFDPYYFIASSLDEYSCSRPGQWRAVVLRRVRRVAEDLGDLSETLLPALVLGLKHPDMDAGNSLFRETGTAHIIALSGFHSGLVALLLFGLFRLPLGYRGALLAAASGLLVYLYLAGLKPSLVRSVLMYLLLVAGKLSYRKVDLKLILICSYLITGFWAPVTLHSLSARLSYLALWGILTTGPLIHSILNRWTGSYLSMALSASLAAQLWTIPLVLSTFGLWYPAGIPASLVLTPLVTLYLYSGIVLLLLPESLFLTFIPRQVCRILEALLVSSASLFRRIPSFALQEGNAGLFLILLFPLLLGLMYRPGGLRGKRKSGFELQFGIRDKGSSRSDGTGAPQTLGTELSY